MDHSSLEICLQRSLQKYLKTILSEGTKIINIEDYPALTEELSDVDLFVGYSL